MDALYREILLDHYKNPKNYGELKHAEIHKYDSNPLCGDEIEIYAKLDQKETIKEIKFKGQGCVICMASASILTEDVLGKKISEINKMDTNNMLKLLGIELTPARIKCMMLSLVALKKGIVDYEAKK